MDNADDQELSQWWNDQASRKNEWFDAYDNRGMNLPFTLADAIPSRHRDGSADPWVSALSDETEFKMAPKLRDFISRQEHDGR